MFDYSKFDALRASKGITKKFVADALGRTPAICQDWKRGKSVPNDEQLKIVADILGTSVDYLLGASDDKGIKNPPVVSDEGNKKELLIKYINHMNQDQLDQAGAFLKWLLSNPEK